MDDEDLYGPSEPVKSPHFDGRVPPSQAEDSPMNEEDDGEQDMDEDSDSDIDIITERPEGSEPQPPPRHTTLRNPTPQSGPIQSEPPEIGSKEPPRSPQDAPSQDPQTQLEGTSIESSAKTSRFPPTQPPYLPYHSSRPLDLAAKPVYVPLQKPIHEVDIDKDFPEEARLWRKPGTDISDFFNYGFDEFTWSAYCKKQTELRRDYDPKRMMEEMQQMTQQFMGGGGPGPGAGPVAGPNGPPALIPVQQQQQAQMMPQVPPVGMPPVLMPPGMEGMPPEMQAMMAQMMAGGGDIGHMDPQQFAQMMGGPPPFGTGFESVAGARRDDGGGRGGGGGYGRGRGRRW